MPQRRPPAATADRRETCGLIAVRRGVCPAPATADRRETCGLIAVRRSVAPPWPPPTDGGPTPV
ncbi:hypothetical protein ACH4TV_41545 [Streptomyces sp. NPDC020898]|uniref:hypothetical protein n=1 Tax=Streptomyces sp. NPDC020898 TaxID=3365101 RepID=UPI00379FEF89